MANISKFGKVNTCFQIVHFLLGACHTVDGAYFLARDLLSERKQAIEMMYSKHIEKQSEILRLTEIIENVNKSYKPWEQKKAEAELMRLQGNKEYIEHLESQAKSEYEFLNHCCNLLQEKRKYKNYSDSIAHEMSQRDEWLGELLERAENLLLTGGIPHNELETFRHHPDFISVILPHIQQIKQTMTLSHDNTSVERNISFPALPILLEDEIISTKYLLSPHEQKKLA